MIKNSESEPLVALHATPDTGIEGVKRMFVDSGVTTELGRRGIGYFVSSRYTWSPETTGQAQLIEGDHLRDVVVDTDRVGAIYSRLIPPITRPLAADKQILNPNALKTLSKQDLHELIPDDYRIPTSFIGLTPGRFDEAAQAIEAMAETSDCLVVKPARGFGGLSTKFFDRATAIEWLRNNLDEGNSNKAVLLQPRVEFGRLPDSIKGHTAENEQLVRRVRAGAIPSEIRMFVLKKGDTTTTVPVLRPYYMDGDKIVTAGGLFDIDLGDELEERLSGLSEGLVDTLVSRYQAGEYMIAALDYVLDKQGKIRLMDFNVKSPALPITARNARAGKQVSHGIVDILAEMIEQRDAK